MKTWEIPKGKGESKVNHEETYGEMGEAYRELTLGGFLSHLVAGFTRE